MNILGSFEDDFSGISFGVGDAENVAVVECYYATFAFDGNVSGGLVAFGVAFDGDLVEVEVAIAVDGDVA